MQLGVCRYPRLNEQCRVCGIHPGGEPIDHHVPDMLLYDFRRIIVSCESVPIGNKEQAFELVLQLYPILQHTVVMPQMQPTSWAHPRQNSISEHILLTLNKSQTNSGSRPLTQVQ